MKKLSNRILTSFILSFFGFTLMVSAQAATNQATGAFSSLKVVIESFSNNVLTALGSLFMGAAVVIFFFGIVQYLWGVRQGDTNKIKTGNDFMIWGLVALFVMFSVYGIVKWGQDIFFKGQNITTITVPTIKFDTSGAPSSGGAPAGNSVCVPVSGACSNPCDMGSGIKGTCSAAGQCCK